MVVRSIPVHRSVERMLFPSNRSRVARTALSCGMYIVSSVRACGSVKVLPHFWQRKRRNPLRCFPKRWQVTWQVSQVIVIAGFDWLTMCSFIQLSLVVCQGKSAFMAENRPFSGLGPYGPRILVLSVISRSSLAATEESQVVETRFCHGRGRRAHIGTNGSNGAGFSKAKVGERIVCHGREFRSPMAGC